MYVDNWPAVYTILWLVVYGLIPAGIFVVYGTFRRWSVLVLAPGTIGIFIIGAIYWWVNLFEPFITGYSSAN